MMRGWLAITRENDDTRNDDDENVLHQMLLISTNPYS